MKGAKSVQSPSDQFKDELVAALPHLRAFARSLCGNRDMADDLVQETATRAWAARDGFTPGTSMRAWTFTILRNAYLSHLRRLQRSAARDAREPAPLDSVAADQETGLLLSDLNRALARLASERRTALLLVTTGDFTYEQAAEICHCPVGTIRSRVARARAELSAWLESGQPPGGEADARPPEGRKGGAGKRPRADQPG